MNAIATLVAVPLFGGLSKESATALAARCRWHRFESGYTVVAEGDDGHSMYVILRGRVAVSRLNERGERVLLHDLGPGEFFGEMSLLAGMKRTADVITTKPSQLLAIDREAFLNCVLNSPEVAMRIMGHLCQRIRQSDDARISRRTARQRLARLLLVSAILVESPGEKSGAWVVDSSRTDLAERILSRRETVSRELSLLANESLVKLRGKKIIILQPARLQEIAE